MDVRPPTSHQRVIVWAFAMTLALVVGVCAAGAASRSRAASLKVSMPASMARGSVLALTASGYSGKYDEVAFSAVRGAGARCSAPAADTIEMQAVAMQHAYKVKFTNIFGAPRPLTICVYLFTAGPHANTTKGHYIAVGKPLKVA
jgi:hypothetical protein